MEKDLQIGPNRANSKKTVVSDDSILFESESRIELVSLEGNQSGMSYCVEQVFQFIKDNPQERRLLMNKCIELEYSSSLGEFLSKMNYQSSETEYQTARLLYGEYVGFCKEHHFEQISKNSFLTQFESLGFKVRRRMTNNETFVYCNKGNDVNMEIL